MLKSGITVAEGLDALANQTKSVSFKKVLLTILSDIQNGQSFTKALEKHPKAFDHFYVSLIEVGEESGNLESNLEFLAKQLAKDYALQKKIQGAMIYPVIVLATAVVIGSAISIFVLPKLVNLFQSLDVKLPLTTKILLFIANLMKNHGLLILAAFVLFFLFLRLLAGLPAIRPRWHKLLLLLPIYGPFLQNIQITTLCRNLGVMLKSGLPLTSALEIEHKACGNLVFTDYIKNIQKAVIKGKNMSAEILSNKYGFLPALVTKMVSVGEKTGKLDEVLLYLGDYYEDEVDNTAKNFSTILEPILLLGMGLVVAFVALAIITPIYQITGSMNLKR